MFNRVIWRKTASTMLAATLVWLACAPALSAGAAWADTSFEDGSVTIEQNSSNASLTFDAYQIFRANVADDSERTATDIIWSDEAVGKVVTQALVTWGNARDAVYTGKSAQEAAEYIDAHLNTGGTGKTVRVASDSLAQAIAKALQGDTAKTPPTKTAISAGEAQSLQEGYWLFVTTPAKLAGSKGTATSPVFYTVVGGKAVTINEKTSVPTLEKTVTDDSGETSSAADSFIGQALTYRLTGTVADNIASYDTYAYTFTDKLADGLELVGEEEKDGAFKLGGIWSVKAFTNSPKAGIDISPKSYDISYEGRVLQIKFHNLKNIQPKTPSEEITVSKNIHIAVTYQAKLASGATAGTAYANEATLEYPNSPLASGTSTTTATGTKTYTYALDLDKVDRNTEQPLQGAMFTLKFTGKGEFQNQFLVAEKDEGSNSYRVKSTTEYEKGGGSNASATKFESDKDGKIHIVGLNAGTYEVVETKAPDKYNTAKPFTFEIKPEYSEGKLVNLSNTVTADGYAIAGIPDSNLSDNILTSKTNSETATEKTPGLVTVTVGDTKNLTLPLTGMSGVTFTWVAGGAVLALTAAYALRTARRRREQDDQ